MIKLGLIGNNIVKSNAPSLINKLASNFEINITYEIFDQRLKENINLKELLNKFKKKNLMVLI